ncbi:MAG: DUF499 domain-containing protein [Rhodospirillales bacterium]|nr:DUF499 domain-containing protein [Rhodospirillales bacterium]
MTPTIFDLCEPREDVAAGIVTDADYAADLAQVVNGTAPASYLDAALFFANTYPTRGLRNLLDNVCRRLAGSLSAASVFRLDTSFGGGKTHALIALVHAARGMRGVASSAEFLDPALLPRGPVRIAEFDGENADPLNGRRMGDGILARTPWGEIAYRLAGAAGYERLRVSDEKMGAPGAETLRELFGGEPTLILLDELAVWLRKVRNLPGVRDQLSPFLQGLFKAVDSAPNAAVVFTLSLGKEGRAPDAHGDEAIFVAERMAEAESVAARKATLLNPTEDDETPLVLRRRLFRSIDDERAAAVIDAYRALWSERREDLSPEASEPATADAFRASFPFHPEVLDVLTAKTATLANFQRVRGMLRILGRTIGQLWKLRPPDASALHLHHIDPGFAPIYQEIVTRLGMAMFVPAIRNDISAEPGHLGLAQEIDRDHFKGLAPYAEYVARTIFLHSLADKDSLKGVTRERLRYAMLGPALDISFLNSARTRFIQESAYLDDRPGAPMRFMAEANLTQLIRREERNVDPGEVRANLKDRIHEIFAGPALELVHFPGGPFDIADDVGNGRPRLATMSYDALAVSGAVDAVPDLIRRCYERKGTEGTTFRALRNNLLFIVADEAKLPDMRASMVRRLALQELKKPHRLAQLAEHQRDDVLKRERQSETTAAIAVQQCYRHLFYPAKGSSIPPTDLAHTAIELGSASERPGSGQQQVVRQLRELNKLRLAEDQPDNPTYIRDRTPLRNGQISTAALREEFRRDPALPILAGDDIFKKAIRNGVEQGEYVYRRGDLLYGKGDPQALIDITEDATIFTMAFAAEHGIWPRAAVKPAKPERPEPRREPLEVGELPVKPITAASSAAETTTRPPALSAEGVLKEALTVLWEKARKDHLPALAWLEIRMFEAADAFRLLGAVAAVPNARREVKLAGDYQTLGGSTMELHFSGTPDDAKPVKDFIEPQLRAAAERHVTASFRLTFENGLSLAGDAPERLAERLTRFASGAAYVSASAGAAP